MPGTPWEEVPVPDGETRDSFVAQSQESGQRFEYSPVYRYYPAATPNDPDYSDQWHLRKINVEDAWAHGDGSGVTVAVIDYGVSAGGRDLACKPFVSPYNTITNGTTVAAAEDDSNNGHGTHVAGTVGECTDNGILAAGVAPGASIMPVKFIGNAGGGESGDVAEAITWATNHGADVINFSFGRACSTTWPTCNPGDDPDTAVDDAITYATDHGVVFVAAAGNDYGKLPRYPANHPDTIAVGATTPTDTLANYSNFGDAIDLVAPGGTGSDPDQIYQESFTDNGTGKDWGLKTLSGTSQAAPHVAGTAALMLSVNPSLTVQQVKDVLAGTAVDLGDPGRDPTFGAGRIDAAAAVAAVTSTNEDYILGGTAAIDGTVAAEAAQVIGAFPTRIAGPDRYATAAAISHRFNPAGASRVYIVTGENFPDTLGVGPVAAMHDAPILLVNSRGVPQVTADELERLSPSQIILVGGPAVINTTTAASVDSFTQASVTRISGEDRYETAVEVSKSAFSPGVATVILVTGETFPDGLAAGPVATALGGPVLLTHTAHLPDTTKAEIERLSPDRVVIVGGTRAVSAAVESTVKSLGIGVVRVAGSDRYETAATLSSRYFTNPGPGVFLATGEAFPDALAGAAAAGRTGDSLLLTRATTLPSSTRAELERLFP